MEEEAAAAANDDDASRFGRGTKFGLWLMTEFSLGKIGSTNSTHTTQSVSCFRKLSLLVRSTSRKKTFRFIFQENTMRITARENDINFIQKQT
jgi:hypothetical protein